MSNRQRPLERRRDGSDRRVSGDSTPELHRRKGDRREHESSWLDDEWRDYAIGLERDLAAEKEAHDSLGLSLDQANNALFRWRLKAQQLESDLAAERARHSEPDMFWDDSDPEYAGDSREEILLDNYSQREICRFQQGARLPDSWGFYVNAPESEDEDDTKFHFFATKEQAEAALAEPPSGEGE